MTRRWLAVLAIAALAAACQTGAPVNEATVAAPTAVPATAAPSAVTQTTATSSPTFEATKYLQMRPDAVHIWSSGGARFPSLDVTAKDATRATALLQMAARLQPAPFRF